MDKQEANLKRKMGRPCIIVPENLFLDVISRIQDGSIGKTAAAAELGVSLSKLYKMELDYKKKTGAKTPFSVTGTKTVNQWISVDERLPEDDARCVVDRSFTVDSIHVIVFDQKRGVCAGSRIKVTRLIGMPSVDEMHGRGWLWDLADQHVTHWMPLPKPPEV